MDDQRSFIEEIRSLGEPVKHKIMLCATVIIMIVVVYLWIAYFNTIVPNAAPVAAVRAPLTASAQDTGGPGIIGLFADTAGSFWQAVLGGARDVAGEFKNPKQYTISPK